MFQKYANMNRNDYIMISIDSVLRTNYRAAIRCLWYIRFQFNFKKLKLSLVSLNVKTLIIVMCCYHFLISI